MGDERDASAASKDEPLSGASGEAYPDLVDCNRERTVLDAIERELLERIVADHLAVLQTAMTVFERNGDYATGGRPRGWCRVMDELSRPDGGAPDEAVASGRWSCRASCRQPALEAMRCGGAAELTCPGGMRVHAVPIRAGGDIVGSISFGCGGPPNEADLSVLAERLGTSVERLRAEAARVAPVSAELEAMALRSIEATARLLGEMVARHREQAAREDRRVLWVGMIAHDLRGPLSAVQLAADLLSRGSPTEHATHLAQRIDRNVRKMRRMVEDLLDLTRIRLGGGIRLELKRASLDAIGSAVVDELRLLFPRQILRWHTGGDTDLDCDTGRLGEVIENLLVNAVRHGGGSPVDVELAASAEEIVLRVHNGGTPIPADALPGIFEPFEQGTPPTGSARSTGLGLGLHISREIVRAHGGAIDAQSSADAGTTFTVRLPRHPPGA
jgi:signal transduction histidine kinase